MADQIGDGDQFGSGFVAINPNSKIPALLDRSGPKPIRVFESGAILMHLAEKFGAFLPTDPAARAECLSWLFWQMGSAPYLGGGFGHFYAYAPTKIEYAIDRFAMEVKRQLDVLDRRLAETEYLAGGDYTIADIAVWPWYGALAKGLYGCRVPVGQEYKHVQRWTPRSPSVRRSARPHGQPRGASQPGSCTSVTMPAISTRKPRTRWAERCATFLQRVHADGWCRRNRSERSGQLRPGVAPAQHPGTDDRRRHVRERGRHRRQPRRAAHRPRVPFRPAASIPTIRPPGC